MVDTQHACEIRRQQVQKPTRPGLEQVSDHAIAKAKAHGVMDVTVRLYSQAMYNPSVRPVYVTVILQTPLPPPTPRDGLPVASPDDTFVPFSQAEATPACAL